MARRIQIFFGAWSKIVPITVFFVFTFYKFGVLTHLFEKDYSGFTYPIDADTGDILVALRSGIKPQVDPINIYNYTFKIRNENKCKRSSDTEYDKVVILYVIKSALNNVDRRNVIRKTWGWEERFSDVAIRRVFILGTRTADSQLQANIDEENAKHKDIVQADFEDTYYNNTIKTMMGFKWTLNNCPRTQFIMFSDDDMYISTKNLLKFLRNPFNENVDYRKLLQFGEISNLLKLRAKIPTPLSAFDGRLLAGYVFVSSPMRHHFSKWFVTLDEYPFSKYPPYVTAGAYVLSYPALEDMYYTSQYTQHFKFDDVYLGIVAKKCGITPLHNDKFFYWKKRYSKDWYKNVIASHGYSDPSELQNIWEEQRMLGHA